MIGFGWKNPWPFRFGGGICTKEEVRATILQRLDFFLETDEGTESYAETAGEAAAVAIIWSCNKRLSRQAIPETMLENLAVWEESTNLKPTNDDSMPTRRAALAGKIRAQINNAIVDIQDVAQKVLGNNYDAVLRVDDDDVINYWPGINPGPPGYEWCSNRAHVAVRVNKNVVTDNQYLDLVDSLHRQLQPFLPSWMTFEVGTGDSFVTASGILGQGLL